MRADIDLYNNEVFMKRFTAIVLGLSLIMCASCATSRTEDDSDREDVVETSSEESSIDETSEDSGEVSADFDPDFTFTTTDREGNTYDESIFADYELTMINFWEPWCPPCVGEMPDIETLYENYQDQGFNVIGVYSETEQEDEVDEVLESCGTTYPIVHYSEDFEQFLSGYVPTTIFVDRNGHVVEVNGESQFVGSREYAEWEEVVTSVIN